jgi:hypothetical protein
MRNDFSFLEYEISQLEQFLRFNSTAIEHYRESFEQWLSNKSKDMSKEQKEDFMSDYVDRLSNMHFAFPSVFFSSFVVTWFSFMEVNLLEICKRLDIKITIGIKEKVDIRDGIERARAFLTKGANYEFKKDVWEELDLIRKVRNIIIHEQGRIDYFYSQPKEKDKNKFVELSPFGDEKIYAQVEKNLFNYLKNNNLYDVFEYVDIRPNLAYCKHLVAFAKELFDDLDKNLPRKRRRAKAAG